MPQKKYTRPRPVRLNEIENIVDDHLKKSGDNFSQFVKKSLLAYLENDGSKKEIDLAELSQEIKKMRVDLSKVGGNLNQLAFYFNTTGIVHEKKLEETHENLKAEFKKLALFFRELEQKIER